MWSGIARIVREKNSKNRVQGTLSSNFLRGQRQYTSNAPYLSGLGQCAGACVCTVYMYALFWHFLGGGRDEICSRNMARERTAEFGERTRTNSVRERVRELFF